MSDPTIESALGARIDESRKRRAAVGTTFFEGEAGRIAQLCHQMAERFARNGRLLALGSSPAARSDARHVAVEFVHPVIVGKRALPALALTAEGGSIDAQLESLVDAQDIVIAFDDQSDVSAQGTMDSVQGAMDSAQGAMDSVQGALNSVQHALDIARERGALTISCAGGEADWSFHPGSNDADIDQELIETLYHVLWELVHVFFEHRGLLAGRTERRAHDSGASSFLYPFLGEQEHDLDEVIADVRASVLAKATEAAQLRARTLAEAAPTLVASALALRSCLDAGGRLLALGNGGSATDAMDLVADLRARAQGKDRWSAIDLTEDAAILTAIANDIGVEAIFSRQVIAHGRRGDTLIVLSTSGGSANVIHALAEARRRGLVTIALVGYDGGRISEEGLADYVVVVRSEHIPRIQEAHASVYHLLCELITTVGAGVPAYAAVVPSATVR